MQLTIERNAVASVDELIERLQSSDPFERAEAARLLCNWGPEAAKALPALLSLSRDPWYQVRIQVPRAIIQMEVRSGETDEVLQVLLNDVDETVKLYAKEAMQLSHSRK